MAEPMNLRDRAVREATDRIIARLNDHGPQSLLEQKDLLGWPLNSLWQRAYDAATTAERERAIAIVERQPYYPDTHTGLRQQWVKDQILAALRGGDHE